MRDRGIRRLARSPRGPRRWSATTGVPRVRLRGGLRRRRDGVARGASGGRTARQPRRGPARGRGVGRARRAGWDHRDGPHPLGHPRAADRPQRPPAPDATGKVAVVHNGIIENFAALRAELESEGVELASDTDTEVAAHLVARAFAGRPGRGTHGRRARRRGAARGRVHAGVHPRRPARRDRRRPALLAAGGRRRRGRDVRRLRRRRVHRPHPRGGRARPGPDRHADPRRRGRHRLPRRAPPRPARSTSTGTSPPPRRAATTSSC